MSYNSVGLYCDLDCFMMWHIIVMFDVL